ncbi:MAG: RNA polymerase sigma factor [Myxococcaceae bacterium]
MIKPMTRTAQHESRAAELYRKYGALIYARCRRMLRDSYAAEDATQEVFLRALKHLQSAPCEAAALPWLYRISSNYCLNKLRDEKRSVAALSAASFTEGVEDFERAALHRDFARRVVMRSPERLRAPAILHYVDGLEQVQVAKALGICRRTVINRLARFTAQARKLAAPEERLAVS